ncbi:hypothetical protein JCM11491_005398 [Sporobolomyces phaffii]
MSKLGFPQPPPLYQFPPASFQFPPPPPPSMHFTSLCEKPFPPPLHVATGSSSTSSTSTSAASSARCSRSGSPITPVDPPPSLFARRSGAPMQISLPIRGRGGHSSTGSFSTTSSVAPTLDSAPLQTPASWGAPPPSSSFRPSYQTAYPPPQANHLPFTQLALDLAPYSALSPSSLSKFNAASAPSFDFSVPPPQFVSIDAYAPATVGGTLGLEHYASFEPADPGSFGGYSIHAPNLGYQGGDSQFYPGPTSPLRNVDQFSLDDPIQTFDPSAFAGSFHLPSPGLTFSSSTPSWMARPQYFCA